MDDKYEENYYEKLTLKCEDSNNFTIEINAKIQEGSIEDMFNTFVCFLKGCGYSEDAIRRCVNLDEVEV